MQIPVSRGYLYDRILSHPDYPSIASITDTLDGLGIDNAALVADKEKIIELPVPFLALGYAKNESFTIVNDMLTFLRSAGFKDWNGIVVVGERPALWSRKENSAWLEKEKRKMELFQWVIAACSLFVVAMIVFNFSWLTCILLLSSGAGLFVSTLLVQQDLGYASPIADQLCAAGKNIDCSAVTNSKGARLPFGFQWSEAGIIYFSSLFLILFIFLLTGNIAALGILSVFSFLSLFFTFYSLYYQWRIVRKWCMLCLLTLIVLWIQAAVLFSAGFFPAFGASTASGLMQVTFIILFTGTLWLLLCKPLLVDNKKLRNKNFELLRFRNNPAIFEALLKQQTVVDTTPFENDLQLGNASAPVQIIIACNPYCGPCAKAHEQLDSLLGNNDIGLTIRFTIHADNKEDRRTKAVEYILQCIPEKENYNPEYKRQLLHDWFHYMDLDKFSKEYTPERENNVDDMLLQFDEWTKEAKIEATPTVFINGFKLPVQYSINDLVGIINVWNINTGSAIQLEKY